MHPLTAEIDMNAHFRRGGGRREDGHGGGKDKDTHTHCKLPRFQDILPC